MTSNNGKMIIVPWITTFSKKIYVCKYMQYMQLNWKHVLLFKMILGTRILSNEIASLPQKWWMVNITNEELMVRWFGEWALQRYYILLAGFHGLSWKFAARGLLLSWMRFLATERSEVKFLLMLVVVVLKKWSITKCVYACSFWIFA